MKNLLICSAISAIAFIKGTYWICYSIPLEVGGGLLKSPHGASEAPVLSIGPHGLTSPMRLVPAEGVEPTHPFGYQILSLARLPIPPRRPPDNPHGAHFNQPPD